MVIELGGSIKLINFEDLDPARLIVVKKIVGSFTKKIAEANQDFKEITIELETDSNFTIHGKLITSEEKKAKATDDNLFYALNEVLEKLKR